MRVQRDNCTVETHTVMQHGSPIIVESQTPNLDPQAYQERHSRIEHALFQIFVRYEGCNAEAGGA